VAANRLHPQNLEGLSEPSAHSWVRARMPSDHAYFHFSLTKAGGKGRAFLRLKTKLTTLFAA